MSWDKAMLTYTALGGATALTGWLDSELWAHGFGLAQDGWDEV